MQMTRVVSHQCLEDIRRDEIARTEAILGGLPCNIALLDTNGCIVCLNGGWNRFAEDNGMQALEDGLGTSYLAVCDRAGGANSAEAARAAQGIRSVLDGEETSFQIEYPCHSLTQRRWFMLRVVALPDGLLKGAVLMHMDISARVASDQALVKLSEQTQQRERMLNIALSSISDFTSIMDRRGRLLFANQKVLDLWGVSLEQAVGLNLFNQGYSAADAARIQGQIDSVFATGRELRDEMAYISPAGSAGFYGYRFAPAFALDGNVEFVVACAQDITQRKRVELALLESVAEFRTLAAAMPQIVWVTNAQRQVIDLNAQWTQYTGLGKAESMGEGWVGVLHPDDVTRARRAWDESDGFSYSYETRLRRADGVYRWWLVCAVSLKDAAGTIVKWIGTSTDIDDLKLAELEVARANRELKQQRTELRLLLDLVPARIWFKDTNNRILLANERAASSVGHTVAQMEGRLIADLYSEEKTAAYQASDLEMMRTGEPALGALERETDAAGNESWIQKDKVVFRDDQGAVVGIVVMAHDITERKRDRDALRELNIELEDRVRRRTAELNLARDEAEDANRAKSEFLATMSHEIRTPMSGLLGLLELLGLSGLDAEQKSTLAVARESGNALLRIIDDVLDFSRIEADRLELNLVAASVHSVVTHLSQLHAQVASNKNVSLRVDVSPDVSPFLAFDAFRLGQILNNFLNNAIKFTAAGQVAISVEVLGRHNDVEQLRFVVSDTGIGMTPLQIGKLFQPFVQAAVHTSSQFGGTGLGLVISRRLAELMGGTVDVISEVGVGTTIALTLAFEICDAEGPARPGSADQAALESLVEGRRNAPSVDDAQADGTLLLVVDDHPTNRFVLMRQLASLGYAAQAAADGQEALAAWQGGRFAAVITDCNMPRMNGYELATAIREAEWRRGSDRIPIIACTANALPAATDFCLSVGMDACLVKPASLADIGGALDRWVPLPRQTDRSGASQPVPTAPPGRVASAPGQGLLDLGLLHEITGGDPMAQSELLLEFRRINELDATALRDATQLDDFVNVTQLAHRVKGSSLMLGASLLAQACERLEMAAAARASHELVPAMSSFETELLRLTRHLEMFPTARRKRPESQPPPVRTSVPPGT
jgi:PAS domain S-box-containing protein